MSSLDAQTDKIQRTKSTLKGKVQRNEKYFQSILKVMKSIENTGVSIFGILIVCSEIFCAKKYSKKKHNVDLHHSYNIAYLPTYNLTPS